MGIFSRKSKNPPQQGITTPQRKPGGYIGQEPQSDPTLPGIAGWCGSRKTGDPRRFAYKRPDGKPDRKRGLWDE